MVKTEMMANIPMVIPNSDKNVRILFAVIDWKAKAKLSRESFTKMIKGLRGFMQFCSTEWVSQFFLWGTIAKGIKACLKKRNHFVILRRFMGDKFDAFSHFCNLIGCENIIF